MFCSPIGKLLSDRGSVRSMAVDSMAMPFFAIMMFGRLNPPLQDTRKNLNTNYLVLVLFHVLFCS